jgi:beta-glucanase (GH16 family)
LPARRLEFSTRAAAAPRGPHQPRFLPEPRPGTQRGDFNGDTLDPEVFGFETGFALRNDDDQFYTERSENAFVEGSELVLVARAETYEQAEYTSASIETRGKRAFGFGRIEAELSLPTGAGVGPAFWIRPDERAEWCQLCHRRDRG